MRNEPVHTKPARTKPIEPAVHGGSNGTEPVRSEPVHTKPARTKPIDPVVHRGSYGPVAVSLVELTRNEHLVARTFDLDQPLQSKLVEPGRNEPAGPATYEPVGYLRSVHLEPVRSEPATPEPAEPVTSFGNRGYRMMEPARPVAKPVECKFPVCKTCK